MATMFEIRMRKSLRRCFDDTARSALTLTGFDHKSNGKKYLFTLIEIIMILIKVILEKSGSMEDKKKRHQANLSSWRAFQIKAQIDWNLL